MEAGTFVGQFGDQEHAPGSADGSVARAIRRMSELRRENPGGNSLSFQFLGLDPAAPTPQTPTTPTVVDATKKIREYLPFVITVANSLRFLWTPSEERPPLSPS